MKSLAALYDVGDENAFIFITSFVMDCWIFVETGPATMHRLDVILHAVLKKDLGKLGKLSGGREVWGRGKGKGSVLEKVGEHWSTCST